MPRAKRTPIDYTPQFGGGIFRSKETIAEELAELEEADSDVAIAETLTPEAMQAAPATASASRPSNNRERTNGRTNERSNERTVERRRVRHSFDIWQDQLLGLTEIQARRFSQSGRKPKLGELVQEALDAYIAKEHKGSNERTVERTMI